MAAPFHEATILKRRLGRQNGAEHGGVDRELTLPALRETPRRQGAKTQSSRGCV